MGLHNISKGTQWCISTKTLNTFILLTATAAPTTSRGGRIIALHGNNDYTNAPQCNVARTLSRYYTVIQIPQKLRLVPSTSLSAVFFYCVRNRGQRCLSPSVYTFIGWNTALHPGSVCYNSSEIIFELMADHSYGLCLMSVSYVVRYALLK